MLKTAVCIVGFLAITQTAFANEMAKAGHVYLNGSQHSLSIEADTGAGMLMYDQEQYSINSAGLGEVDANLKQRDPNTGAITKDMTIQVLFKKMSSADLKQVVDNANEVLCDDSSNAVVLLSDNQTGKLYGNCAVIN